MTTTTSTPYQTVAPVRTLSIASFALGAASIVFGWTLVAPVAGLVLGIMALKREPLGRTWAIWGIVLNAVMLAGIALVGMALLIGVGVGFAALPFAWI
ncbi:hypothetical protein [Leifsonia sp. SIMBA_070]|uniref:hypothetical protein n=1 Tax=Leifsonia sp. SIMBA_070 TaxID=3085810 RepID=UPI00397DBE40